MTIAFNKIILPRHHNKVFSGQHITIMAETIDTDVIDHLVYTTESPNISVFDPNGVQLVNDADMVPHTIGLYSYQYPVPFNAPLGVYTGNFSAIYNISAARLEQISLFKVIKTSVASVFTYQVMIDQDGVAWYWYVDRNEAIVSSQTLPDVITKQATASPNSYRWLAISEVSIIDDLPVVQIKYISPDLDGTPMVSDTQPPIGTGTGSPVTFTGLTELDYQLTITETDEIIVAPV